MIIVQERLLEAFDTLPEVGGFKPKYRWGNEYHLMKLCTEFQKDNKTPYPLIYQTSNRSTQDTGKAIVTLDLSLMLAVRETNTSLLNENRWAMSYRSILFPLVNYIEQLFSKQQMFVWDRKYTLHEFPNYGNGKENGTIDIWDALRFDTSITINKKCITQITYKNDTN